MLSLTCSGRCCNQARSESSCSPLQPAGLSVWPLQPSPCPNPPDTELPDINVPGMPFNDEAQELLRQAAAIQAAPSGSGGPDAAGVADERGMAGDGGGKAASGAGEGHLVGEHVHERKGHPERSFPQ